MATCGASTLLPDWPHVYIGVMVLRARSLFLTALIALSLVISGQAIALAKGASPATGYMVLCTGHGTVVLFTDQNGDPTATPHLCPDCTLAALTATPDPDASLRPFQGKLVPLDWPERASNTTIDPATAPQARGPPQPV